jgi:Protein of unknown function (DUF3501)
VIAGETSGRGPLTLADIAEPRAYERERDEFRRRVIAAKKLRRLAVGPVVTLTFENRVTVRFQVQEMARAEKMLTDAAVQHELDTYNKLLPGPGELSATLFLELTSDDELRTWLPRLVGIERAPRLVLGEDDDAEVVTAIPEAEREAMLTREETTSAVHYVRFALTPAQIGRFEAGPVRLGVDHPAYPEGLPGTLLSDAARGELAADLRGT